MGNIRVVQIFAFFEGRAVNAKIKTGRNSHAPVFHMQSLWWVWFLSIETRILKISSEGLSSHSAKIYTLENFPLYCCVCTIEYNYMAIINVLPPLVGFMSVDDLYKIFPSFVTQFVTLMQRFEVVLLLDSRRMLIPSLLPTLEADSIVVFIRSVSHSLLDKRLTRSISSESEEDQNPVSQEVPHAPLCQTPYPIVSRYYVLSFVPKGFFTRVIARLMSKDIMDHLHESLLRSRLEENHLLNAPHWRCWRDGISIIWNHMEIFRIAPVNYPLIGMHTTVLLSNTGGQEVQTLNGVEIKVAILPEELVNTCSMIPNVDVAQECYKGRCIASWLLHQAVTVIDSVFEDWYEAFSKKKGFELSTISSGSPCTTCFRAMQTAEVLATTTPLQRRHSTFSKSYDVIKRWSVDEKTMYLFSSMYCSLALEKGVCLCCPTHGDIKVAEVAPDLVIACIIAYC